MAESLTNMIRELRHAMDELANRSSLIDEARAQEKMLETTYNSLATTLIVTAFNVLFAYLAATGRKIIYDKVYSEVASLLPLWIFAALGFPFSLLFLRRIRLANPARPRSPSHSNDKVALTTSPSPTDKTFSSPILEGPKPAPSNDMYPMGHIPPVAYSPQPQGPAGRGTPASMDMGGSSTYNEPGSMGSRGSDARLVPVRKQPFYSSYATRRPIEVQEEVGSPGWGSKVKGWRG
ncbi:hypothetical protein JCM1841_000887 [Sporobolomyces salmonicolor]